MKLTISDVLLFFLVWLFGILMLFGIAENSIIITFSSLIPLGGMFIIMSLLQLVEQTTKSKQEVQK